MIVVADASACASFLLPDEAGPFAAFAREIVALNRIHAPPHWPVEMASILKNAHRRKRIDTADLTRLASVATEIAAQFVMSEGLSIVASVDLAVQLRLTPYDAAYVGLAQTLRAVVLTTDKAMADSCVSLGIDVLHP